MIKITNQNDFNKVLELYENVLVKVGTSCCGPCKVTEENMQKLEGDYPDFAFITIDADEANEDFVDSFNIRTVPTCFVYKKNDLITTVNGLQTEQKLIELLNC